MKIKNLIICFSIIVLAIGYSSLVHAGTKSGLLNVWGGWTEFQYDNVNKEGGKNNGEDWVYDNGNFVNPGSGGQEFDAEYLFYKISEDTLSLGLQTGYDIVDGRLGDRKYWAGDIALSFDRATSGYSHAVDFGLRTKDHDGDKVGLGGGQRDEHGLYSVTNWNSDVKGGHSSAVPFAMDGGQKVSALSTNSKGSGNTLGNGDKSYFRKVSFDIKDFREADGSLYVKAHWTMSCGNDAINGHFDQTGQQPVPEPGTIALLGVGLVGLAGVGARRRLKLKDVDKS